MVSGAGGDRKSRPVLFWAFTALLVVGLNLYAPGDPTDMERLLASTIVGVTLTASIWFWMGRRNLEIAFIPLFSIMFAINYALGIFLLTSNAIEGKNDMRLLAPTFNLVLILSLASFLLILLAYYGPWWRYLIPRMPKCQLCSEDALGSSAR